MTFLEHQWMNIPSSCLEFAGSGLLCSLQPPQMPKKPMQVAQHSLQRGHSRKPCQRQLMDPAWSLWQRKINQLILVSLLHPFPILKKQIFKEENKALQIKPVENSSLAKHFQTSDEK